MRTISTRTNRRNRHVVLTVGVLLVTVLLLAACGGEMGESATNTTNSEAVTEESTNNDAGEAVEGEADTASDTETATESTDDSTATDAGTGTEASGGPTVAPPDEVAEGGASDIQPVERNGMYSAAPEMTIDPSKYYYATLKTAKGDIEVQLFAERAPVTVNNFVFLAREGYYNNTSFHRVLADFMAQAGDPTGTGSGGPGYQFGDEFDPSLTFDREGLLAMANAGPGTNGSQFFITFGPTEWLNNRHTIFGEVVEGLDILDALTLRDPNTGPDFEGDTLYTIIIEESDSSELPPPPPTPTPFPPSTLDSESRPLAELDPAERVAYFNSAPEMVIDAEQSYTATITTSQGDLVVSLKTADAPVAVNNFVLLANLGFYDNVPINQVTPGQLVIFGSPDNNPSSDAGYMLEAELNVPVEMGIGLVGYVPFQGPASSSSQILISLVAPPIEANAEFSFFGEIIEGADILAQLTGEDTIEQVLITMGGE